MAKTYQLISGDAGEVNRQLALINAQNQKGVSSPTQKPILMSSAWMVSGPPRPLAALMLTVIVETET